MVDQSDGPVVGQRPQDMYHGLRLGLFWRSRSLLLTKFLLDLQTPYFPLRGSLENGGHGTEAYGGGYRQLEDDHGLCGANTGHAR